MGGVLYLIDGSNYIFRAYHAIKNSLTTSEGFPTNALFGFSHMLLKFIRDYDPEYLCVVFDSKGKTFRNDIYPQYKANRDETPEDLAVQFPRMHEIVEGFGITSLGVEGYEADDVMGALAKMVEEGRGGTRGGVEGVERVVLVTGDKDMCQLVSDRVTLLDTMRNRRTDVRGVVERFGVPPERVTDVQALAGDAVDNVPGVRGIGEKRAVALVKRWGDVEDILQNVGRLEGTEKRLMEAVDPELVRLFKRVVTIDVNVPMDKGIGDFRYEGPDRARLRDLFKKYEFWALLKEMERGWGNGVGAGEEGAGERGLDDDPSRGKKFSYEGYRLVTTEEELGRVVERISEEGAFALDLETTSRSPMIAEIVGIAIAAAPGEAYYIPTGHRSMAGGSRAQLGLDLVLNRLRPLIEDDGVRKYGQNLKYEMVVLERYGVGLTGIYSDAMLAAHLMDSSRLSYGLDALSMDYLGHRTITYADVTGKGRNKIGFDEVELEKALHYAGEDADVSLRLGLKLMEELEGLGLLETYSSFEIGFIPVLASMEREGVRVDAARLGVLSKEFDAELERIREEIHAEAGVVFNINSTKQLRRVLFEELGLEVKKRTKTGEPSTDVGVMEELAKYHTVPAKVLEYRALSKLKSTYVDALPRLINPGTGRIHTSFNQVGAATGRLSSSDPNLQNIPIKSVEGKRIREAFVPEEGCVMLSADYSQIELRLLAHFSEDEALMRAFWDGLDIHRATARDIFGLPAEGDEDVTPEMRRLAKNINFGIVYGISPFGLAKQLGTSVSIAKGYMDEYFGRYPGVKSYMEWSVERARERGYAETILGRRRPIPELRSRNRTLRGAGERAAINTPIQGSAADIIKVAMIRIHERLKGEGGGSRMILQVHDELLFEVPEGGVDGVRDMVVEEMEGAMELRVPLKVDVGVAGNWAEAH